MRDDTSKDRRLDGQHQPQPGESTAAVPGSPTRRASQAIGLAVGLLVFVLLAANAQAQPGSPGYFATLTAQAGGGATNPTATFTFTTVPGATNTPIPTQTVPGATATFTSTAASSQSPTGPGVIANGRGRIANVRARAFTVLWTSDVDTPGQVNFGATASLGATAQDRRGGGFSGRTHYVEIGELQPSTTYYFDLQTSQGIDSNGGQHFQVKTGPELGNPPQSNVIVGGVLNPGGVSPAGGALIWATVRDANGQGSPGSSQLAAALAGDDGRFQLDLGVRTADLGGYFTYSPAGDQIDLTARAPGGEVSVSVDTAVTQNGGASPSEVRLVLGAVATGPTPASTATNTPSLPTVTVPPGSTPTVTVAANVSTAVPTATIALTFPTALPTATAAASRPPIQMPVQLPPLKDMLLAQLGLGGATPTSAPPAPEPRIAGAPGAAVPEPPIAGAQNAAVPEPPIAVAQSAAAPATPIAVAQGAPGTPIAVAQIAPATAPLGGVAPGAPADSARPPLVAAQVVATTTVPGNPPSGAPINPPTGLPAYPPAGAPINPPAGLPGNPPADAPAKPILGQPVQPGPGNPAGGFTSGTPVPPLVPGAPVTNAPAGQRPSPTITATGPLAGLESMPPLVSALFYGGVIVALLGAGIAIYSLLAGPGWRPR